MTRYLRDLTTVETQYYLQHLVAPRPICFASTVDRQGRVNLSPFSFFNLFSANPPIVIFSPSRRVRDNTTKHTLENLLEVPEVVINLVTYDMVQQTSLASCEYPKGVDEFIKAGFTREKASLVAPPRVKESKAQLECRVNEIKSLGQHGGAGQLVIAEVLCMHIHPSLLTADEKFIQEQFELVARLGGDWYTRVTPQSLFQVPKPNTQRGMGIDSLPARIRNSTVLSGNHLGMLANVSELPSLAPEEELEEFSTIPWKSLEKAHRYAATLLDNGHLEKAWQVLLQEIKYNADA